MESKGAASKSIRGARPPVSGNGFRMASACIPFPPKRAFLPIPYGTNRENRCGRGSAAPGEAVSNAASFILRDPSIGRAGIPVFYRTALGRNSILAVCRRGRSSTITESPAAGGQTPEHTPTPIIGSTPSPDQRASPLWPRVRTESGSGRRAARCASDSTGKRICG